MDPPLRFVNVLTNIYCSYILFQSWDVLEYCEKKKKKEQENPIKRKSG